MARRDTDLPGRKIWHSGRYSSIAGPSHICLYCKGVSEQNLTGGVARKAAVRIRVAASVYSLQKYISQVGYS